MARKFESGHRIISGPSGSGKTLILVHKAGCFIELIFESKTISGSL